MAGYGGLEMNPPCLLLPFPHRWGFSHYVISLLFEKKRKEVRDMAGWRVKSPNQEQNP
jgi:hypothetical protein